MLSSFKYKPSNYFDKVNYSSENSASHTSYLDMLEDNEHIDEFAITSKVITAPYLNVFMELTDNVEDNVFNFNTDLKPEDDRRGLRSGIITVNETNWSTISKQRGAYIKTINDVYSVRIDSTDYEGEFILSESKQKDLGFETFVGIKDLEEGKHLLKVLRKRIKEGDTVKHSVCRIPFWYFKD